MALKSGNIFIVQKLTGHKTLDMVTRYVNVKADDVVNLMHAPEPTPQAPAAPAVTTTALAATAAPGAMTPEALQVAMQVLQAAAAQLNVQAAAAGALAQVSGASRPVANEAASGAGVA